MESRQLTTYDTAQKLAGVARRTFFKRLKEHNIVVYVDPADRRLRWIERRDVERIAHPAERGRRETSAA